MKIYICEKKDKNKDNLRFLNCIIPLRTSRIICSVIHGTIYPVGYTGDVCNRDSFIFLLSLHDIYCTIFFLDTVFKNIISIITKSINKCILCKLSYLSTLFNSLGRDYGTGSIGNFHKMIKKKSIQYTTVV